MNQDKLIKEIERLQDILATLTPGTEQYKNVSEDIRALLKMYLEESKEGQDQVRSQHEYELKSRELDIQERKVTLEEKKLDQQDKVEAKRLELEEKKIANESERNLLEDRKLDQQEEDTKERTELEREKLRIQEKEVESRIEVEKEKIRIQEAELKLPRFSKGQAIVELVKIPLVVGGQMLLIGFTGRIQETSILDKNLFGFATRWPKT